MHLPTGSGLFLKTFPKMSQRHNTAMHTDHLLTVAVLLASYIVPHTVMYSITIHPTTCAYACMSIFVYSYYTCSVQYRYGILQGAFYSSFGLTSWVLIFAIFYSITRSVHEKFVCVFSPFCAHFYYCALDCVGTGPKT